MRKNNNYYGSVNRKVARKGILSFIIGIVTISLQVLFYWFTYNHIGSESALIGAFSLMDAALAGLGIWLGVLSFHEPDRKYGISYAAIGLNGIVIVVYLFLFILGLR